MERAREHAATMSRWVAAIAVAVGLVACGGGGEGGAADVGVEVLFPDLGEDAGLDLAALDPGPGVPDPGGDEAAGPCDEGDRRCLDGDTRAVCQGGAWMPEACSTRCALQGVASLGCDDGECTCADPRTGCTEDATTCQGADVRAICQGGAWKTTVCSVECAGQGLASLGCTEGACTCGTPPQCTAGETRCQGANTVALCLDGQWSPVSCTVQCAEAGLASAGCVGGACACTDQPPVCDDGEATCETSEIHAVCVSGQWQATPCTDVCAAKGQDSHGCLGETCQCVDKPACYVGETQCVASTTLATCNGASWDLAACTDLCAAKGMLGDACVDGACACTPAPDCADGQVACDGASRLTCQEGAWASTPCATTCGAAGLLGGSCSAGACACLGDAAPACAGCLSGACAASAAACRASPACASLAACLSACDGAAPCTEACLSTHALGLPGLGALLDCTAAACPGACPDLPPCFTGQARCASSSAAEQCQGGQWIVTNCAESCYAKGLTSAGCSNGACACVYEPFVCEHGAVGCPTPQSRATCQYGHWGPQVGCANECAAGGQISQGCTAGVCTCEAPCTAGQRRCGDADTLLSCDVPPMWSPHVCEAECSVQGLVTLGCGPGATGDDCRCVDLCGLCLHEQCAEAQAACVAASCGAWIACDDQCWYDSYACGEYSYECYYSCALTCTQAYPNGPGAWSALYDCQYETCGYHCQ